MGRHITQISMIKGIGILFVIITHMLSISRIPAGNVMHSVAVPAMELFFLIAGYTASAGRGGAMRQIIKKTLRLFIPYYLYSAFMLVILFIIYVPIGKKSLAWFADGSLGILFQLQSFHFFDSSATGVHPMFYGVLVGWFIFQMVVSNLIFIPLLYLLQNRSKALKLIWAAFLLLLGAVLYILDLQGLNGEYFPEVCKIFILPNIPGIAGIMILGNYLASISFLDPSSYSKRRIVPGLISLAVIIAFILTDDGVYDFPIGKWGAFGPFSYILSPIYGIAMLAFCYLVCSLLKRIPLIRNVLVYLGDNSKDYLILHFFTAFLTAYIGGFWTDFLTEEAPYESASVRFAHFIAVLVSALAVPYIVIRIKRYVILRSASGKP